MKKVLLFIIGLVFIVGVKAQSPYMVSIPNWPNNYTSLASMATAPNGHVFILGKKGYPYVFNGISISQVDSAGLPFTFNHGIDVSSSNTLWLANDSGLYKFENNVWLGFNPQNSPMPSYKTTCLKTVSNSICRN